MINMQGNLCRAVVGAVLALSLGTAVSVLAQDPTKVIGPAACTDCHEAAVEASEASTHQTQFARLHTLDEAKDILAKLELRSARREECVDCHYTMQQAQGRSRARAIAGVTCESCHSHAADWLDIHNDYGRDASGAEATAETESAGHRTQRLQESARLGMIRPDQPYLLAQNCFQCHTVPREKLVNTGGHTAGSDFELVSWLGGEVRHNFQRSADAENREAARDYDPAHRRRILYVMGQMLDLEHALRGLAEATSAGPYTDAMIARARAAGDKLKAIQAASPTISSVIQEMLDAFGGATLAPGNRAGLVAIANQIQAKTQSFAATRDGSKLATLDRLIPGKDAYKGTAHKTR